MKNNNNVLENTNLCTGCGACYSVCPKNCIEMTTDELGFYYPSIKTSDCAHCNLCKSVCPVLNTYKPTENVSVFACANKDKKILQKSSSGGAFYSIAKQVIQNNGVVFGARYTNQFQVVHDFTENLEGLITFMGSKYVQSYIGESYKAVKKNLDAGRQVLFTGTPCQISGLKHYLRKEYKNLLLVDIICHSCPSPKVWETFIKDFINKNEVLKKNTCQYISMRYKNAYDSKNIAFFGKEKLNIESEERPLLEMPFNETSYGVGFFKELFTRKSCFHCISRNFASGSDITIGDFWNANKHFTELNNITGASAIIVKTEKGYKVWNKIKTDFIFHEASIEQLVAHNPRLIKSGLPNSNQERFLKLFTKNPSISTLTKQTWLYTLELKIKKIVKNLYKTIKKWK